MNLSRKKTPRQYLVFVASFLFVFAGCSETERDFNNQVQLLSKQDADNDGVFAEIGATRVLNYSISRDVVA